MVTIFSVSLRSLPREVLALSVCPAACPTVSTVFACPVASSCCTNIIQNSVDIYNRIAYIFMRYCRKISQTVELKVGGDTYGLFTTADSGRAHSSGAAPRGPLAS